MFLTGTSIVSSNPFETFLGHERASAWLVASKDGVLFCCFVVHFNFFDNGVLWVVCEESLWGRLWGSPPGILWGSPWDFVGE